MAAKKVTVSNRHLAVDLKRVRPALAGWRQRRRHREAIPDELWGMMVPLARAYGVSPVAQALGLNYTALKQRTLAEEGVAPLAGRSGAGFVEVAVPSWPSHGAPWSLELEDGGGTKLRVRLVCGETTSVLKLAQGLWRQRR
jgi:hypothetical protein